MNIGEKGNTAIIKDNTQNVLKIDNKLDYEYFVPFGSISLIFVILGSIVVIAQNLISKFI
jgi:hypothetical protein